MVGEEGFVFGDNSSLRKVEKEKNSRQRDEVDRKQIPPNWVIWNQLGWILEDITEEEDEENQSSKGTLSDLGIYLQFLGEIPTRIPDRKEDKGSKEIEVDKLVELPKVLSGHGKKVDMQNKSDGKVGKQDLSLSSIGINQQGTYQVEAEF